ncbi:HupE/UreJ family protein [Alteromonas sp. CI.11.F.A3]|uniref:HupE/UreJ family protein n=1 Tax=Alteromonas sp. CI.11.F.A3 TaxID=3079555 RepID=UPI0029423A65|nr:HupE/UreJ family protein [Alteromonas sp. CI.11.F.A3]WOI38326.1 HupE/UreJ family protein [Alteromonas sp. CI.11.F.A3]
MKAFVVTLLLSFIVMNASVVNAHELSSGYLTLNAGEENTYSGELLLKPDDIGQVAGLDTNGNGALTWGEIHQNQSLLENYIANVLSIRVDDSPCKISLSMPNIRSVSGDSYLVSPIKVMCKSSGTLGIRYDGIFEHSPTHKLLVNVNLAGQSGSRTQNSSQSSTENTSVTSVLDIDNRSVTYDAVTTSLTALFISLVYEGVRHIFIGIDHILFLVATLLTVNLVREQKRWQKEPSASRVLKHTVILVSAFTLAHSITLTATALDFIALDSRLVELGIAISVLLTALNNIYPLIVRLGIITFAFGLLHGMGFASVFADLNAQSNNLVLSVAAFNIGVEVGQLAIVAVLLPLLLWLRHFAFYAKTLMPLLSLVIAIIATNWTIQRW